VTFHQNLRKVREEKGERIQFASIFSLLVLF